jgi:hypothetical protein
MRKWLVKWLMTKELREREREFYAPALATAEEAVDKPKPKVRIAVMEAMNGKLLEVQLYQRNSHGPDWKTEYYILDDSRPLAEQIAVVMTMRGMGV